MFKNWFKKSNSNKHNLEPRKDPPPPEVMAMLDAMRKEIMESPYPKYLEPLSDKVVGKTVASTLAGTSGFVLSFYDSGWIMAYLEEGHLSWKAGQDTGYETISNLINSSEYGNGYNPIPVDKMYAKENCDIKSELANAKGKVITGLSIGLKCFNFRFEGNMELDTSIVPTDEGKPALRVFWEHW